MKSKEKKIKQLKSINFFLRIFVCLLIIISVLIVYLSSFNQLKLNENLKVENKIESTEYKINDIDFNKKIDNNYNKYRTNLDEYLGARFDYQNHSDINNRKVFLEKEKDKINKNLKDLEKFNISKDNIKYYLRKEKEYIEYFVTDSKGIIGDYVFIAFNKNKYAEKIIEVHKKYQSVFGKKDFDRYEYVDLEKKEESFILKRRYSYNQDKRTIFMSYFKNALNYCKRHHYSISMDNYNIPFFSNEDFDYLNRINYKLYYIFNFDSKYSVYNKEKYIVIKECFDGRFIFEYTRLGNDATNISVSNFKEISSYVEENYKVKKENIYYILFLTFFSTILLFLTEAVLIFETSKKRNDQ